MLMPEVNNCNKLTLSELLADEFSLPPDMDSAIRSLQLDSRRVAAGDLFIALEGATVDGRSFVPDAIAAGAIGVLVEAVDEWEKPRVENGVPVIPIPDLPAKVGGFAARFYNHPSASLDVMAVTGTNGKTSCTQFIAGALNALGVRCGVMGTIGYGLPGTFTEATHTTPDPVRVQELLADLLGQNAEAVALEASSHGLEQGRLNGVAVRTAIFTNLSRDHLDYHANMDSYGEAKRRLFLFPGLESAVINIDDEFGRKLAADLSGNVRVITYSRSRPEADILARSVVASGSGFALEVQCPDGSIGFQTGLLGSFNVSNLLAAFGALWLRGYPPVEIAEALATLTTVSGRMERIGAELRPAVIVDYAHTPDALENVLSAVRDHCSGELWCVFGCGGNRDPGKRPQMGEIAARLADHVIVTDDNPRRENPEQIVAEILSGIPADTPVEVEHNRSEAIRAAIGRAAEDDMVVIAGKGHETYQDIDGRKWPFSDLTQARQALEERQKKS